MSIKQLHYSVTATVLGVPAFVWLCYEAGWKVALAALLFMWANNISLLAHIDEQKSKP